MPFKIIFTKIINNENMKIVNLSDPTNHP